MCFNSVMLPVETTSPDPPQIITQPMDLIHIVSDIATFRCTARGFPVPDIIWVRDGEVVNSSRVEISNTPTSLMTSSILTIFNLEFSDTGNYSCTASNELTSLQLVTSEPASLTVNREFQFYIARLNTYW